MTRYVVDASVIGKWLAPEENADAATRLLAPRHELLVPEFAIGEVASLLVKKVRQRTFPAARVVEAIMQAREALISLPSGHLVEDAALVALKYDRAVFDCLYLQLAIEIGCQYVTADGRAYKALMPDMADNLLWIEQIPAS